ATPRVVVRAEDTGCEIIMEVENLSAAPMDLMYLCPCELCVRGRRADRPAGSLHARARRHAHRDSRPCYAYSRLSRDARRPGRRSRAHAAADRARALRSRTGLLYQGA